MAPQMLKTKKVDVLHCKGDLNAETMVPIRNRVEDLVNKNHKHMLLDLARTKHVDLAGLGILVDRIKDVRDHEGDIKLCHVSKTVQQTFRLVGLAKLVESFETPEEAMRSFKVA